MKKSKIRAKKSEKIIKSKTKKTKNGNKIKHSNIIKT